MEFPNFFSGNIENGVLGAGFRGEEAMAYAAVEAFADVAIASVELHHSLGNQSVRTGDSGGNEVAHKAIALARKMLENVDGAVRE